MSRPPVPRVATPFPPGPAQRHRLRPLPLPEGVRGRLWLSAMPGRFAPLPAFLEAAEDAGATAIANLALDEEIAVKSPDYARWIRAGGQPYRHFRHPIPDFGLPSDPVAFAAYICRLCAALQAGDSVILHCAAGVGRTGVVAQQLLMALGTEARVAEASVRCAGSGPETPGQQEFCFTPVFSVLSHKGVADTGD